ncbi:MAG: hypothetical protein WCR72_01800 [Bacteroidota bacterium]
MKILFGCEESQTVTIAFRNAGHEAYSNDLKPCSGGHPEWHLQMDVNEAIDLMDWDMIGLHPVCTKMTLSGNRHYAPGKEKHFERLEAVEWAIKLWQKACKKAKKVYMENPIGAMNSDSRLPKPQIIQPYYFGDEFQKTTCLWLKGLNFLYHNSTANLFDQNITHVGKGEMWVAKSGKVMPKWVADTPSTNNEANRTIRSKTFEGIATAMAEQWSRALELV